MKKIFSCCSIRTKILIWVVPVAFFILLAVMFWTNSTTKQRIETDKREKALYLVKSAANLIDSKITAAQSLLHGLAFAIEAQYPNPNFEQTIQMQKRILNQYSEIFGICIAFEPDKAPENWSDIAPWVYRANSEIQYMNWTTDEFLHTKEAWYYKAKQRRKPTWSDPYEDEDVLMVTYSIPIYSKNNDQSDFIGIVSCDIPLDWLNKIIAQLPLGEGGYGLLINKETTYISHPSAELVLNESVYSIAIRNNDETLKNIGTQMVSGETGLIDFTSFVTNELSWLAYTPLQTSDWTLAALISHHEMNDAIATLNVHQSYIGLVGLLLLIISISLISGNISKPIINLKDSANELAQGNLDANLPKSYGNNEISQLINAFSHMRSELKQSIKNLTETTAAKARIDSELKIAHDIQMGLIPKTFPPFPSRQDIDLYAIIEPARQVGGDFYDFFMVDEENIAITIGDVSGKGVPAALFMAVSRSFLRSAFAIEKDPAKVIENVNNELVEGNDSCMFVTIFCALFNINTGKILYTNAGHNYPIILDKNNHVKWLKTKPKMAAGIMPGNSYSSEKLTLEIGDSLILYTDGVTEAMNSQHQLYGEDRLEKCIKKLKLSCDCKTITSEILHCVKNFTLGAEQSDDITLLVVQKTYLNKTNQTNQLEVRISNTLSEMQNALDKIELFLTNQKVDSATINKSRMAIEELVVNCINYGYKNNQNDTIIIMLENSETLNIAITDSAAPFNPLLQAPEADTESDVDERQIGGLGIHMIKAMNIELKYTYKDEKNINFLKIPKK